MTSLKQTCNEYLIRFSDNLSAPKLENRKTSPCSPRAPNLLHVLPSRMVGWNKLCNPASDGVMIIRMIIYLSSDGLMIVRMIIYLTSDGVMMIRKPLPSGPGNRLANNWGKNLPLATLFGEIANRHYWTNSYLSNIRKFR